MSDELAEVCEGASVSITGLQGSVELNGLVGRVLHLTSTGRWQVDLGLKYGVKALKPENLVPYVRFTPPTGDAPGELIKRLLQPGAADDMDDDNLDNEAWDEYGAIAVEEENGGVEECNDDANTQCSEEHQQREDPYAMSGKEEVEEEEEEEEEEEKSGKNHSNYSRPVPTKAPEVLEQKHFPKVLPTRAPEDNIDEDNGEEDELSTLSVKELKERLRTHRKSIPVGVTEKKELVELLRQSIRQPEMPAETKEPKGTRSSSSGAFRRPKGRADKHAHCGSSTSTTERQTQQIQVQRSEVPGAPRPEIAFPHSSMGPPPGMWSYGYPPGPPVYGYPHPPAGYAPYGPPPFVPQHYPPPPPLVTKPRSREEAVARGEERLRYARLGPDLLASIERFSQDYRLSDEVKFGMRILYPDVVQHITANPALAKAFHDARNKNEAVLSELQRADPDAGAIVRALLGSSRRKKHEKSEHRRSNSRRSRSRSRHRRRSRAHRDAVQSGSAAAAPPRAGVWASAGSSTSKPVPSAATRAVPTLVRNDDSNQMAEWLTGLDSGRGNMLRYLEPLQREFGSVNALAATLLPEPSGNSVVGWVDPSLWEALGVEALGHKMLLAKGIVALIKHNT